MPAPVDLSSSVSREIISLLEKNSLGVLDWQAEAARLEMEHGPEAYRSLLFVLTNLDYPRKKAKKHWRELLLNWQRLQPGGSSIVDLRVAALHYFLQVQKELKNPTVVEIKFLQETQDYVISDELTQTYNYRYFQDRILQEVRRFHRYGRGVSLLMVDVDDFKLFNDRNGHVAGNGALRKLAQIFKRCVRDVDVVCRYGGEEFAIVLPSTLKTGALTVAEKIRARVEKTPMAGEQSRPRMLTISIGVATVPMDATTVDELTQRADAALYRAKAGGKNRVDAFSDERREFVRYEASLNGRLRALDEVALPIRTANISQGGLLFLSDQPLPVGHVLQLSLSLPRQSRTLPCTARVVRAAERDGQHEIGVVFIHLEGQDLYRLRRYLTGLRSETIPAERRRGRATQVKRPSRTRISAPEPAVFLGTGRRP